MRSPGNLEKATMGNFLDKVRHGNVAGPRKRAFTLESWKKAFDEHSSGDNLDKALYTSGAHIHAKLNAIRAALAGSSLAKLSTETHVRALVAMANREFHMLEQKMGDAAEARQAEGATELHAEDLSRLQVTTADGQSYDAESTLSAMVDGIAIPVGAALGGPHKDSNDNLSDANLRDISLELNLGMFYDQAENLWEDCVWNTYILGGAPSNMVAVPTDIEAKRGVRASATRKIVLGIEAMSYAAQAFGQAQQLGIPSRIKQVKTVRMDGDRQRIEVGHTDVDPHSQTMLFALLLMACPPYFESLLEEAHQSLGGLSISQLFDGWMVVSLAARRLWEDTYEVRRASASQDASSADNLGGFIPFFTQEALVNALEQAAGIQTAGAYALVDFLTFNGGQKQQLWTQPLVSVGGSSRLYPVAATIVAPPNLRFVLELWMAQIGVDFGQKGTLFERHLRQELVVAASSSPLLREVAKVVPNDFTFTCADERFAQFDALFCIGAQVFVVEAKCILEPTESNSIGTHRKAVAEGAQQAKERVTLINEHRSEFVKTMAGFGWNLPDDFSVHPLVVVSTAAHVGVPCDGVPVVDELVLERFFSGAYERVGLDTGDFSVVQRIRHPFYSSVSDAERCAAAYFANPPQLQQYLESLTLRQVPIYAASSEDWQGMMVDWE
jgi:hypothetical protein